ncbi:type II secretion system protein [Rhodoferax sp.]|uniref:type II secretion system protein n=1 Tax=Rhodoferax sp. TaxID=50421 RepID=UPI0039B8A5CB
MRGFTLIEMVMVIIILGVIGAIVAVFMKKPVDAYFDTGRRAALTDVADTAVRRIGRDVRRALPNSLRLPLAGDQCIEFIPTKTGGRYRALPDTAPGAPAPGELDFAAVDASFNMLGDNAALPPDQRIAAGDLIAVYNLGIAGANAYNQDNTDTVSAAPGLVPSRVVGTTTYGTETSIITAGRLTPYPLASPNNRFHVIPAAEHVVTYVCANLGENTGKLYRYARPLVAPYATPASCPAEPLPAGTPVLARNVTACSFVYTDVVNNNAFLHRNGLLQVRLELTRANETVSLYHEVNVDNTP